VRKGGGANENNCSPFSPSLGPLRVRGRASGPTSERTRAQLVYEESPGLR
jgi:hypothetical protein